MPTLREVRGRIIGVKKTQKITRAMKMVAAAKLRRAQSSVIAARPYAATLRALLGQLAAHAGPDADPAMVPLPVQSIVLVVITGDRGLCGAFNTNVLKATQARINTEYSQYMRDGKLRLVCIGKKGADFFRKNGFPVAHAFPDIFAHLTFPVAQGIARKLVGMYRTGEADRIEIIANEFKNVAQQKTIVDQFLPIQPEAEVKDGVQHALDYIYEPDGRTILSAAIPRYLDFRLWRSLLESNAAEVAARMTAMENATENAEEMISTLQLQYNKARQAAITTELLEIVSGAEALEQG